MDKVFKLDHGEYETVLGGRCQTIRRSARSYGITIAMLRLLVLRYLLARRGMARVVTVFSLLGMVLGVAALIVVLSVMAGFRAELTGKILGVTGHALISRPGLTLTEGKDYQRNLKEVPEVISAEPFVLGQGMLTAGGRASGAMIRGILPAHNTVLVRDNIVAGDWYKLAEKGTIALGAGLAQNLGVKPGHAVTLLSPQGTQTAFGFIPRMQKMRVVALFSVGMHEYDGAAAFMNMQGAQTFFRLDDRITGLELRVTEPEGMTPLLPSLKNAVPEGVQIRPWMDNNQSFFEALQVERLAMFIILTLIVVVAAFNIITGQTMAVQDKRNDIAILRTMGATRYTVLKVFFINGLLIGLLGTGAGVGTGLLVTAHLDHIIDFCEKVLRIDIFPADVYHLNDAFFGTLMQHVSWNDVTAIVVMSLTLSLLASLYPAWLAGRTSPVEVLRNG